ncbi:MAG: hypothetical protein ACM3SQ_05835 [Betaproteobacteria bacterium]
MVVAIAAACASAPLAPSRVTAGQWGGTGVSLMVTDKGGHVEFDCAHGDLSVALTPDQHGQFSVPGTFVSEHGGPIRAGESETAVPVTYLGVATATTMTLSIRLDTTGGILGTYSLTRGAAGRLVKCL